MPAERRRDAFRAISDPRRRSIIELITQKRMTIATIASHFDISQPAIYEQMKILGECRLLIVTHKGNKKYFTINLKKLDQIITWVEKLKRKKSNL
jgi:DNA-binding transcriptional ArsR family regulator